MNKKVSTLLTMGLFLGGSLFNIVSAENLSDFVKGGTTPTKIDKLESGKQYFLGIGGQYLHSKVASDKINYCFVPGSEKIDKEDLQEYLWTVTEAPQGDGTVGYTFANAKSGEQIYFVYDGSAWTVSDDPEQKTDANSQNIFVWKDASDNTLNDQKTTFTKANVKAINKTSITVNGYFGINSTDFEASASSTSNEVTLYSIADGIDVGVDDLNDLYNSAGFNFTLNDDKLADVGNIFADKRVVALKVNNEISNPANSEQVFPKGTYFATSVPYLLTNGIVTSYDYLVQCTFIAVDSDNNISDEDAVADNMKAGKGFTLTEVSGKDLVLYKGDEDKFKSQGDQIAVCNAVFTVKESATSDVYKLTVENVRTLEKADATKQVDNEDLDIVASKGDAQISTGTYSASGNFIFKFAESTVEKGISFLKKEAAPSIYNIKFYLKNGADDSYNGKYLTMNATGSEFVAKGTVLADLDAPVYQWLITKVDGNNVTFTNRETGKTLETQLFKEDGGRYSLAPKAVSTGLYQEFKYYIVDKNGDVVEGKKNLNARDAVNFRGVYVELEESEAVNYSDYLDVEDESLMTLSFGRDIAPTSNKLYPIVKKTPSGYIFADDNTIPKPLTDDISKAAQWLLIKTRTSSNAFDSHAIKYNYAYANGDLVNIKNNGDVVYAYTYKLQLVLDGKAIEGEYLNCNRSSYSIGATGTNFFIQENEDGSVLLKAQSGTLNVRTIDNAMFLNNYQNENLSIGELIKRNFSPQTINVYSESDDVKTYLIAEAPAISLPGNEGHYSIASTDGNYITMNDERDAMTVKEASEPLYLYVTDKKDVVPSFYVTKAAANKAERMFLFNPQDSINYYVGEGKYDKTYQLVGGQTKAIFKAAAINETRDTLTTNIKGVSTLVAVDANNTNKVSGGLDRFKMQIVESADADGTYVIRQKKGDWLQSINGALVWGNKVDAMKFDIEGAEAPTSNESVAASEVKVIANNGSINVKNAAGKNVVVSTILGQVVANEVLTSDNATINVPAGIVVVAVEGESFKVNVK